MNETLLRLKEYLINKASSFIQTSANCFFNNFWVLAEVKMFDFVYQNADENFLGISVFCYLLQVAIYLIGFYSY